jgi:hypothetical protein
VTKQAGPSGTVASRGPFLVLAVLALLAAMWAGLVRMGWRLPVQPLLPTEHGPLMVAGFLGTLISLERAVALEQPWTYASPLFSGLGGLLLLVGFLPQVGIVCITLGSLGMVAIFAVILRRQPALFTGIMCLGAVLWLAGNLLWLRGWSIPRVVPWWMGFLVLTIVGERLELSRLSRPSRARQAMFLLATAVFVAGMLISTVSWTGGLRVMGLGMLGLALWLLRFDLARRTIRQRGLTRFIAACLLSGYAWLGIGGLLALVLAGPVAGPIYDAVLHTVFLGFVFALIFGHAPVIFPAVLRLPITYRPVFYAHLGVLQLSLALRVVGDLAGWTTGRQWGGLLNVVAVLLFLGSTAYSLGPRWRRQPV